MLNGAEKFNEATRVQMPALVHLTRLGYTYFGKITEKMAGGIYDPDTNILREVFKNQFAKLNPKHEGEAEEVLRQIRQELDNDDLGRSFYKRLTSVSPIRLVDLDYPENNVYHCTAEFTCKRDQDEFCLHQQEQQQRKGDDAEETRLQPLAQHAVPRFDHHATLLFAASRLMRDAAQE